MKLCRECVNFLSHVQGIYHCDFECWENTPFKDAILNCAEMFECENFESLDRLISKS